LEAGDAALPARASVDGERVEGWGAVLCRTTLALPVLLGAGREGFEDLLVAGVALFLTGAEGAAAELLRAGAGEGLGRDALAGAFRGALLFAGALAGGLAGADALGCDTLGCGCLFLSVLCDRAGIAHWIRRRVRNRAISCFFIRLLLGHTAEHLAATDVYRQLLCGL